MRCCATAPITLSANTSLRRPAMYRAVSSSATAVGALTLYAVSVEVMHAYRGNLGMDHPPRRRRSAKIA
jgi:hypothetical protein